MKIKNSVTIIAATLMLGVGACSNIETSKTTALIFDDTINIGNTERNPADQFLVATPDGRILMSWTEAGAKPRSRDAYIEELNNTDATVDQSRRINDQPGRVHFYGGDNRTKFTVAPDGSITAIWAATLPEFRTGEMRTAHADQDSAFIASARLNDDELRSITPSRRSRRAPTVRCTRFGSTGGTGNSCAWANQFHRLKCARISRCAI